MPEATENFAMTRLRRVQLRQVVDYRDLVIALCRRLLRPVSEEKLASSTTLRDLVFRWVLLV